MPSVKYEELEPHLEPHIRKLVKALLDMGISTIDSCHGHLHRDESRCGSSYPYVRFDAKPSENSFWQFLRFLGKWNDSLFIIRKDEHGKFMKDEHGELQLLRPGKWCLAPFYSELSKSEFITFELAPEERNHQRDPSILQKSREEAEQLAEFLSRQMAKFLCREKKL